MRKITYKLKGLNCANCAVKIEENTKLIDNIKDANLVFSTQSLSVEVEDSNKVDEVTGKIKKLVKKLEPDVEVMDTTSAEIKINNSQLNTAFKKQIPFLLIGSLLFIFALIIKVDTIPKIILYGLSYLVIGHKVLLKAMGNILRGQVFDENFLMSIATLGAFAINEYSEAVAVMLFYMLGEFFQDIAVNNSRNSIKSLLDIRPDYANLKTSNGIKKVSPEVVSPEDIIIVKPGEKVPLDGIVINSSSFVDTSSITGESVPRKICENEEILSGFVNSSSTLTVRVTKSYSMSTVSKILDLVENAASNKATTENFITKFARYYTPTVVLTALAISISPPLITGTFDFYSWIYRALIFLVISCPCALVISIPLSFFSGIGAASSEGILIKGSNYLEALNDVKTVIFDKTGTLTKGTFKVVEIVPNNNFKRDELLKYAAYAEAQSNHPIAKSIISSFNQQIDENMISHYEEIPGHGVKVIIGDDEIVIGNDKAMHINACIEHDTCNIQGTVVHVAVNNIYAGYLLVADELKSDSIEAISKLRSLGISKIAMLTGDSKQSAKAIGGKLGIDDVYSELLPHEKVEILEKLELEKESKLIFVGDGINDAPVLTRADIGISMGAMGSDAAIESSDIVLMTDEPSKLFKAITIARKTRSIVLQNIVFALGIKLVVLLLGALGFATMWEAVFADVGVTLIAVFNSLRILRKY